MNIAPVIERLVELGFGDKGKSLFAYYMPTDTDFGILVLPSGTRTGVDPYIKGQRHGKFQVIVRHNSYPECADIAHRVAEGLQVSRETIDGIYFHQIRPTHEPLMFPPSDGDKIESSINFQAVYVSDLKY